MTISLAENEVQRNSARTLLNRSYAWRGYGDKHEIKSDAYHTTFTASYEGEIIGTLTLGVDSSSGLAIDNTFRDVIDEYRRVPGASVCELVKLAFEPNRSSKPMLASLFHVIFIYGWNKYDCTDLFIEVCPRHARFYEGMLGFKRVGEVRTNESVNAPAQLLHLKVSEIRDRIRALAGEDPATSRSLYPYFFRADDERRIYAQLVEAIYGGEADDLASSHLLAQNASRTLYQPAELMVH